MLTEVPPKAEPETGEQEWGSEKGGLKTVQGSLFYLVSTLIGSLD